MMLEVEIVMALQALRAWLDKQGWRKLTAPEHFLFERVIIYFQNMMMEGPHKDAQKHHIMALEDRVSSLEAECKAKETMINELRSNLRGFVSNGSVVDEFRMFFKSETGKTLESPSSLSIIGSLRDSVDGRNLVAAQNLLKATTDQDEIVSLAQYGRTLRNFIRREQ
jgi:hypothetical protein